MILGVRFSTTCSILPRFAVSPLKNVYDSTKPSEKVELMEATTTWQ